MVLPILMFTNLTDAQQRCVQIHYTKFHQNWTLKVENIDRNLFKPISKVWLAPYLYHKIQTWSTTFYKGLVYSIFRKSDEQLNQRLLEGHHLCISVEVMEFWERLYVLFKLVTFTHLIKSIINNFYCLSIHYASLVNEHQCVWLHMLQKGIWQMCVLCIGSYLCTFVHMCIYLFNFLLFVLII